MKIFKTIPLFGLMLVAYTLILAGFYYNNPSAHPMDHVIANIVLPSHQAWTLRVGDAVVLFGLILLFAEILKSTNASDTTVIEHVLSTFVFIFYMIAFLLAPMVANSTFLILTMMSLIDVIAGFNITINTARRDFTVG
ncbi:MAG: hypothetical protein KDH84_05610 [Calditrichaeota bacterium]|nr:hypothetical protein [Calditrichota bacterium]